MATSARIDELRKKFDENPRRYFAPLANEYRKQGDLAQAIALCRTHLPNQPGHISGHIVLAQALCETRELDESRGVFEQALDLDPENLIALRYLGDIAREQGQPSTAQSWYQRVLDADPRNDEIRDLLRAVGEEAAQSAVTVEAAPAVEVPAPEPAAAAHAEPMPWEARVVEPSAAEDPAAWEPVSHAQAWEPGTQPEPADHAPPESAVVAEGHPSTWGDGAETDIAAWFDTPQEAAQEPAKAEPEFVEASAAHDLGEPEALPEPDQSDWFAEAPSNDAVHRTSDTPAFPDFSVELRTPTPARNFAMRENWDALLPPSEDQAAEMPVDMAAAAAEVFEAADVETVAASASIEDAAPVESVADASAPVEEPASADVFAPSDPEPTQPAEPVESTEAETWDPDVGRVPSFAATPVEEPPAPFVTETMAELYLHQGFNEEALAIYRQLLAQHPSDETLAERVRALEENERTPSLTPLSTASQAPGGPTIRDFFRRIAARRATPRSALLAQPVGAQEPPALGGAARRDEALTQPDEPASDLASMFRGEAVSASDQAAADSLSSAFGASQREVAPELSLDTLFGEVPRASADAVTSAVRASGPEASATLSPGPDGEASADIERFTAWLEGLKKK